MKNNPLSGNKLYRNFFIGFLIVLFLPFVNLQPWLSPTDWGKTIILRIVMSILIFLFIKQLLYKKEGSFINRSVPTNLSGLIFWLLIIFSGMVLISSALSPDPHYSFLASPQRSGGSLNLVLYIIFSLFLFLIVRKKDWGKLWNFAIGIGTLVSLIAIFQYFHLFGKVLITYTGEIPSTIGGPAFLGMYLLLLIFPLLSLVLTEPERRRKVIYSICLLLFIAALMVSQSQAAYIGLILGVIYFILFAPRKLTLIKGIVITLIFLGIAGTLYLKANPENPLNDGTLVRNITSWRMDSSRLSAWKVSLQTLKDRPIIGYGWENFSIPFDKHYDPSLEGIKRVPRGAVTGWWDRAHNFILEIAITLGFPALIVYLSIFALIFLKLGKIKKRKIPAMGNRQKMMAHAIQASFIGYFAANFFNFDTASTYIILFFIIAYSLYLISSDTKPVPSLNKLISKLSRFKKYIVTSLFILLIIFIWIFALKPLQINKELNWGDHYATNNKCQEAINKVEPLLKKRSIIDSYVRLKYVDIIRTCMLQNPAQKSDFAKKAVEILEEAKELRPIYTRTWFFIGTYINIYIENTLNIDPVVRKELLEKADWSIGRAYELSPRRQEIWTTWIKTNLLQEKYQEALEKALHCIDLNSDLPFCWWGGALAHIYLQDIEQGIEYMNIAIAKGYNDESNSSLSQLLLAYLKIDEKDKDTDYYLKLAEIYEGLIAKKGSNFQNRASLAYVYQALGEDEKAVKQAILVFAYSPYSLTVIEDFLSTIPFNPNHYLAMIGKYEGRKKYDPNTVQNYLVLAFIYKQLGKYGEAKEEAMAALEVLPLGSEYKTPIENFLESLPK